ncbi:MAG TPA: xanthine dehydrogenase family protein subunit M [Blastocatellia bacterium]|nr:xanthine dehydrogenase family protein subunit M [Blastocatellia bacterium]
MIPAQFDYLSPQTLDEAVRLLGEHTDEAKILAGGHSLIPAMKLRLAMPQILIDLGRIRDLSYIREEGDQIRIGAMTTYYEIESSERLREICPLLPETAAQIGDVQVRNKGTIGGSLAHSDPAADLPAAIIALGAEMVAVGANGERVIKADDFFVDLMTTALDAGEILREIRITAPKQGSGQAYLKMPQPASGFAVVGVAVTLTRDQGGACQSAGVGVTGVASKAYRATGAEAALVGSSLDEQAINAAAATISDGVSLNGDLFASAEFRKHLAEVYARRAIQAAASRAK